MTIDFKEENFFKIANILKANNIAVIPTDTIYGFSGDPNKKEVIKKIQNIKNRSTKKPFLLLVANIEKAKEVAHFDDFTEKLAQKIWPDTCTFILPRKKNALENFFPEEKFLAIRVPEDKNLLRFLDKYWKKSLISTSVNIADQDSICDLKTIKKIFKNNTNIAFCYDINEKSKTKNDQLSSTIIKIDGEKISILREGMLSKNKINNLASSFLSK